MSSAEAALGVGHGLGLGLGLGVGHGLGLGLVHGLGLVLVLVPMLMRGARTLLPPLVTPVSLLVGIPTGKRARTAPARE